MMPPKPNLQIIMVSISFGYVEIVASFYNDAYKQWVTEQLAMLLEEYPLERNSIIKICRLA